MKNIWTIYILLFVLLFFPVLDIGGHLINITEFYVYLLFLLNLKKIKPLNSVKIFIVYMILFFGAVVFTALLAGKTINNYDLFILRNCAQLVCLLSVLYFRVTEIKESTDLNEFKKFLINCFGILSLPVVLIYLQKFDLFGAREFVQIVYKPQFFFLGANVFSDFRYTSIFKDFFTAGIYFTILASSIFYFYLSSELTSKEKAKLIVLMIGIFVSQVFVSRTSLVVIPFNMILMTLFASGKKMVKAVFQLLGMLCLMTPVLAGLLYLMISANFVKSEWVSEAWVVIAFMTDSDIDLKNTQSSSFDTMQSWNKKFFNYLSEHPEMLIAPKHEYDLKDSAYSNAVYTDSFYPQEIYRYGIYGLIAYLYLVIVLLKEYIGKNNGLAIIVISFILLNYKGGNVFFMPKNIYMYAFIYAAMIIWDNCKKTQVEVK